MREGSFSSTISRSCSSNQQGMTEGRTDCLKGGCSLLFRRVQETRLLEHKRLGVHCQVKRNQLEHTVYEAAKPNASRSAWIRRSFRLDERRESRERVRL